MVVKTADLADVDSWETSTLSYPMVETVHEDSICKLVYAPARGISDEVNRQAQHLARRAVAGFKGRGIFGVESFLMGDGQILVVRVLRAIISSVELFLESSCMSFESYTQETGVKSQPSLRSRNADTEIRMRSPQDHTTAAIIPSKHVEYLNMTVTFSQYLIDLYRPKGYSFLDLVSC